MKSVFQSTKIWAAQRGLQITAYDEIGSTNDEAKQDAFDQSEDPVLYLADHQTQGRGRGKNHWLDTGSGESLLSSWSLHLPQAPQAITGPRIGDALFRSVESVWPSLEWSLKPPNDLYLFGHKIAGLLVETVSQGSFHRLIIGLGLNVLNHPRTLSTATHFTSQSGDGTVNESEWYQFLDAFSNQIRLAATDVVLPNLTQEVRTHLLKALNAFHGKKEPFLSVSPIGDLVNRTGTIAWTEQ